MTRQDFLDLQKEIYKINNPGDNFSLKTYNEMLDRANKNYDEMVETRYHRGDRRE